MKHKVLVVDDELMMTELLSDHLGDEGYEVCTANSAKRALDLLPIKPHLIILDINMPEERKLMQASIAHDLRNSIAIIEGYTEYPEEGLKNSEVSREKIIHIAENLNFAAKKAGKIYRICQIFKPVRGNGA